MSMMSDSRASAISKSIRSYEQPTKPNSTPTPPNPNQMSTYNYKHFLVDKPLPYVAHVQLNRPKKLNAFFEEMWLEFKVVFDTLSLDSDVRAIVLSGAGNRAFTAGLDVEFASQKGILKVANETSSDAARRAVMIKRDVEIFQDCIGSVEKCEKRMCLLAEGCEVCAGLILE